MSLKDQWYQARVQRQSQVKEIHQVALLDKQQRQTEIAERQQEVAQQREQNRAENAERRQYVWGDQAGSIGLSKSEIAQPMESQNSDHSHQEHDHQDQ